MSKFRENTAFEISIIKDDIKTAVHTKLAEITELHVYLLNATENLQKVDEKMDILFESFSSMMESAKAELIDLVCNKSVQSTSTDHSELTKHISTCFDSLTSHLNALFDEAKKGEVREKPTEPVAQTVFATSENLLTIVDTFSQRLDVLE